METEKDLCQIAHNYETLQHYSERTCVLSLTEGYFHRNVFYAKVLRIISDNEILKPTIGEKFGVTVYIEVGDMEDPRCIIIRITESKIKHISLYNCPPIYLTLFNILKKYSNFKDTLNFILKMRKLLSKMYLIRQRSLIKIWKKKRIF